MAEKPTSGDAEQRERQTRVSREQSGLPPEPPDTTKPTDAERQGSERDGAAECNAISASQH